MHEHRMEARFDASMASVFTALVLTLAQGRWSVGDEDRAGVGLPRDGMRFSYRHAHRLFSGKVLECLRPVSMTLHERYDGPAATVHARQRWRLVPLDGATLLRADLRVEPNSLARLQLRYWKAHFADRASCTCAGVRQQLLTAVNAESQGETIAGATGQNKGRVSIVSAKTTSVSGRPILR
jgi:hypothetical protein